MFKYLKSNIFLSVARLLLFAALTFWIYFLQKYSIFSEYDGIMQFFAGKSFWETGHYKGWASHFWPPLFGILISLGDPVFIGKTILLVGGMVAVLSILKLSELLGSEKTDSLIITASIISTPFFISIFTRIENHILETTFIFLGVLTLAKFLELSKIKYILISGIFIGIAATTRYTAYSLIFALGIFFITSSYSIKKRVAYFLLFFLGFSLSACYWWYLNWYETGNPLSNQQYINVGGGIFGGGNFEWVLQSQYSTILEIILNHPLAYLTNFLENLILSFVVIFSSVTLSHINLLPILFPFTIMSLLKIRDMFMSKFSYLIILIIFSYVILCSQAFIFADALTPVTLLSISLSFTYFLISFKHKIFRILLIFQILVNLFYVFTYENDIQISGINKSRIHSHKEVIEIINDNYSDGDMLVSSLHPIYGYYLNQNWIMTPQNNINLCDMVRLNINEKIFNYAPKIEISPITNESKLNFIILTSEHILNWDFVNDDLEINADLVCSDQVTSIFNNGHVNLLKVF